MSVAIFLGPNYSPEDLSLFEADDVLQFINEGETMAPLLFRAKKFKGVGEARRNGWDKPIPLGWTVIKVGKGANLLELFIWNPEYTLADFLERFPE